MSPAADASFATPLGGPDGPRELPDPAPTPFAMLGLEPSYVVDPELLRKRLVKVSRWLHPDFYGAEDQERERALAERNTAELNAAHDVLSDDYRRADWLVLYLGGPDQEAERAMPQEFLMEVLEWNEVLEEGDGDALEALAGELNEKREETMARVESLLTPLPEPGSGALTELRRKLNAVRYVDRALGTVKDLRLERAKSR